MAHPVDPALIGLAEQALTTMDGMANAVAQRTRTRAGPERDVFVQGADNSMGDPTFDLSRAAERLAEISETRREELAILRHEPIIARVRAADEDGKEILFYISRVAPEIPSGIRARFASYRSPFGRLAALPVGATAQITLPRDGTRTYEVLERALVRPRRDVDWDAFDSDIETPALGRVYVTSLRGLLRSQPDAPPEDMLAALLAAEGPQEGYSRQRKRSVVERMGLRDQPVLDAAQDAIFRLPLDARVLLTGPPGSGKTTTLIKRLGMKLVREGLTEDEQDSIPETPAAYALPHAKSWIMFTPTELLGLYVREAFNKEGIPATQSTIQTWDRFSRSLGRATLPVLRSATGAGVFSLADGNDHLTGDAVRNPEAWHEDFDSFNLAEARTALVDAGSRLAELDDADAVAIAKRALDILGVSKGSSPGARASLSARDVERLLGLGGDIEAVVKDRRSAIDAVVKDAMNENLRRNPKFVDELGAFVLSLQEPGADADGDDDDDDDDDDIAEAPATPSRVQELLSMFASTLRSMSRAAHTGRSVRGSSRAGKVAVWLGTRAPTEAALAELGSLLATVRDLRTIGRPTRIYMDRIARSYAKFRRARLTEERWYGSSAVEHIRKRAISSLELDVILLLSLRRAHGLLKTLPERLVEGEPRLQVLRDIRAVRRNQVVVDEATDFSAIQLACMLEITSASTRSFFACGDLHQRVTPWGLRNEGQLRWVSQDFDIRPISVGYRQSTELTRLAQGIARMMDTGAQPGEPPAQVDAAGVRPALAEGLPNNDLHEWLAARIREIELHVGRLPSVAVFVSGEDRVLSTARDLSRVLADHNLRAVDCPDGRVIGADNDVRVFDVRHIKGLEFEAVFFLDVDRLAATEPDLFAKYLYVGTTRAATFLGLTCAESLPTELEALREQFGGDWRR